MEDSKFVPWTEIELSHNIRKSVQKFPELCGQFSKVKYRGKIKLHGTNAAIRIDYDGTVTAFSRSGIVTPENDNAGFAKWVTSNPNWSKLSSGLELHKASIIIYGEWSGPGIQKGVAISKIQNRIFAVFAVRYLRNGELTDVLIIDHDEIYDHIRPVSELEGSNVYILPWHTEIIDLDWLAPSEDLQLKLDQISSWIKEIETCDPWVSKTFQVDGTGEGLVFYPYNSHLGYKFFSDLGFKAKGEKHQTVVQAKPAQVDAAIAANIEMFVKMVVTPARLEQGVKAVNGELVFEMKKIPLFLKWMQDDLIKETADELAVSGLDGKQAYKACGDYARSWYLEQSKKL